MPDIPGYGVVQLSGCESLGQIVTGTGTNQLSPQLSTNHQHNDVSYYNGPEGA